MTKIWTAQYRYSGPDRLDITVKGNDPMGRTFAPTWQMVNDFRSGKSGQQAYIQAYGTLLTDRFTTISGLLVWMAKQKEVTLVCFCPSGAFCHRVLLAKWLASNSDFEYMGERRTI